MRSNLFSILNHTFWQIILSTKNACVQLLSLISVPNILQLTFPAPYPTAPSIYLPTTLSNSSFNLPSHHLIQQLLQFTFPPPYPTDPSIYFPPFLHLRLIYQQFILSIKQKKCAFHCQKKIRALNNHRCTNNTSH
ncbi:hypothetical protein VCUG_01601 [Vavraia culicis subsp. floridensis]|uniref:Uncharacterized protein n=1 Tax=Vavraia culicis (isolate floridensis) TaxID=948595 RepID=L2GUE9_VAVCU|nr:uncharacterized protein VCUG_01601 [Vavraia culicis subsp. floridensis]ELA46903.1 hypothetical protein VCUG_01601 [Vavraia culicis subsp. floridensis]